MKVLIGLFFIGITVYPAALLEAESRPGVAPGLACFTPQEREALRIDVEHWFLHSSHRVALIARTGRPRHTLPDGIAYTHTSLMIREALHHPDGRIETGVSLYALFQGHEGEPDKAYIGHEFLDDFIMGMAEPDLGILIPGEALQERLLELVHSGDFLHFYREDYSLLANPLEGHYDNCVSYLLRLIAAALESTSDPAKANSLIVRRFAPQRVRLSFLQRIALSFSRSVATDDQPRDHLQTATFGSLMRFLEQENQLGAALAFRLSPENQ